MAHHSAPVRSTGTTGHPPYVQSVAGCLESAIGRYGLSETQFASWLDRLAPAVAALQDDYESRRLPHLRVPEESADIVEAEAAFARLCRGARAVIFFGIGGSSLGGQALAQLGGWHIPGTADEAQKMRPRTRFYDNLDGETLASALGSFDDLAGARFVVISKSGGTPETLVQALAALAAVKAAGLDEQNPRHVPGRHRAEGRGQGQRPAHAVRGARHPRARPPSGHRRALLGVDQRRARRRPWHAGSTRVPCGPAPRPWSMPCSRREGPRGLAPAEGAAVAVALAREKGIRVQVMMPYADRLGRFSHWFAQLWAESLGKNGQGTAPIACLGPVDQHSQLQLFMDGPHEHLITLVRVPTAGAGPRIDAGLATAAGLGYLAGRTAGDLVAAQAGGPAAGTGARPAGRCAPSISPALTSGAWAR